MTVATAIPFITFALYVNPILRLLNLLFKGLQKVIAAMSMFMAKVALCTRITFTVLAKVIRPLCKNIGFLAQLARLCFSLSVKVLVRWRPIYRWIKDFRKTNKEAKKKDPTWKKRQYVTRKFLEWWQQVIQTLKERKGEGDEEEQRGRSVERGGSDGHGSDGSLNREDELRVEEVLENGGESPRPKIETNVGGKVEGETEPKSPLVNSPET